MRTRLVRILAVVAFAALVGATPAVGASTPTESAPRTIGQVSVSATVLPSLTATFTGDGVVVRSNIPWVVSAETAAGERIVIAGGPTVGRHVVLPDAAHDVEVCAQ